MLQIKWLHGAANWHIDTVDVFQVRANVADAHSTRIHAENLVVETVEVPLVLLH